MDQDLTTGESRLSATDKQFQEALALCREVFVKKLHDYGPSWRILRPSSLTDQIFIKAKRIRFLETSPGSARVDEGILPEFMGIVNYGIVGLIQLDLGFTDTPDISDDEAIRLYDQWSDKAFRLMQAKNHDYNEAWRSMRTTSYTDMILTKIARTKQIEVLGGTTLVSEGIDANYMDMINYAVFAIIKLTDHRH